MNALPSREPPRNRAEDMMFRFQIRYKMAVAETQKDSGKRINVVCSVGLFSFDLYRIRVETPDILNVTGKDPSGNWVSVMAPVEQVSFAIVQSAAPQEKPEATPPRTIGFAHAEAAKDVPFFGPPEGSA